MIQTNLSNSLGRWLPSVVTNLSWELWSRPNSTVLGCLLVEDWKKRLPGLPERLCVLLMSTGTSTSLSGRPGLVRPSWLWPTVTVTESTSGQRSFLCCPLSLHPISMSWRKGIRTLPVSYTHLRAHETVLDLVCRLL